MLYDGMECNPDRIQSDPALALNDPEMNLCVNVLSAGRPNYLYICLDSIFRSNVFHNDNVASPDVFLYVDKLFGGVDYVDEILSVASHFPIQGCYINKEHKGIAKNYWDSFDTAFRDGYDFCVYLEEDWLITTDAIEWVYRVPKIASYYSLYRWEDKIVADGDLYAEYCVDTEDYSLFREGRYVSWSSAFQRDAYQFIRSLVKANGDLGIIGMETSWPNIVRLRYADWDRIITALLKQYNLLAMIPPQSLLAHFGCQTTQQFGYGTHGECHDEMFRNEPSSWLDNVARLFESTSCEEKKQFSFMPFSFRYR